MEWLWAEFCCFPFLFLVFDICWYAYAHDTLNLVLSKFNFHRMLIFQLKGMKNNNNNNETNRKLFGCSVWCVWYVMSFQEDKFK